MKAKKTIADRPQSYGSSVSKQRTTGDSDTERTSFKFVPVLKTGFSFHRISCSPFKPKSNKPQLIKPTGRPSAPGGSGMQYGMPPMEKEKRKTVRKSGAVDYELLRKPMDKGELGDLLCKTRIRYCQAGSARCPYESRRRTNSATSTIFHRSRRPNVGQ